ncbi:type VI secretion system tube protein Hcp [Haloarcula marina]|uniref:type VI secretion system tube protein Hcp n=1 Tax=Haloarcula marina TaxID=2961574 RepID=UPI0020B653F1|nr:type VI secretion system tube protein Hcp [Halomicroarcula marina]
MTGDEQEDGEEFAANRRDFMKFGGLAAGGLLGTGIAGGTPMAGVHPQVSPDAPAVDEAANAYLLYNARDIVGEPFSTPRPDLEDASTLLAVEWQVDVPGDDVRQSQVAIGEVVVVKAADTASVPLYQRFQNRAPIGNPEVVFFGPTDSGSLQPVRRLRLRNAVVTGIFQTTLARSGLPETLETVSLRAQEVTVVDETTGQETTLTTQTTA